MDPNDQNGGGEGGGTEVPDFNAMDHDAYYEHIEKEPVEAVPLDRFKKVYSERKEALSWKKEHEPKFGELGKKVSTYETSLKKLGDRVAKHPHLKAALEQLLTNEDGSYDQQALAKAIQGEIEKLTKQGGDGSKSETQALRDEFKAELQKEREERAIAEINRDLDRAFASLPARIKADTSKAFEGVDVDDDFLAEVEVLLNTQGDPNDVEGSVFKAAQQVAARHQKLFSKVLGRQVDGGRNGAGAGTLPSKGPGGKSQKPLPDGRKNPEARAQALRDLAKEVDLEIGSGK